MGATPAQPYSTGTTSTQPYSTGPSPTQPYPAAALGQPVPGAYPGTAQQPYPAQGNQSYPPGGWQTPPVTPQATKTAPNKANRIVTIVLVLGLLVGGFLVVQNAMRGDDRGPIPTYTPRPTYTPQPSESENPTDNPSPSDDPSVTEGPSMAPSVNGQAAIGEPVVIMYGNDELAVTVTGTATTQDTIDFLTPSEDNVYIVVPLQVDNQSQDEVFLSTMEFVVLVTNDGLAHTMDSTGTMMYEGSAGNGIDLLFAWMDHGSTATGALVFQADRNTLSGANLLVGAGAESIQVGLGL